MPLYGISINTWFISVFYSYARHHAALYREDGSDHERDWKIHPKLSSTTEIQWMNCHAYKIARILFKEQNSRIPDRKEDRIITSFSHGKVRGTPARPIHTQNEGSGDWMERSTPQLCISNILGYSLSPKYAFSAIIHKLGKVNDIGTCLRRSPSNALANEGWVETKLSHANKLQHRVIEWILISTLLQPWQPGQRHTASAEESYTYSRELLALSSNSFNTRIGWNTCQSYELAWYCTMSSLN